MRHRETVPDGNSGRRRRGRGHGHHEHEPGHQEGHHGGHHHGHFHGHFHGHRRRGRRGGRLFDYGDLRLLLLAMLADAPSHGYELIKAIEERFGGGYSPSPGVIYPTLAWLDDMGYAVVDAEEGGRKRYRITAEGEAFLAANREAADALFARAGEARAQAVPAPIVRAMENLKVALRLRLGSGPIDTASAQEIAAALDAVAQTVERSE